MRVGRALMLGLLFASVGCGGSDAEEARPTTSTSRATSTTTAPPCGEESAEAVTLTTRDGTELNAVLVGDGEVGVVLGHQLRSDYCSWVPFAKQLAERHMRALAINFVSTSPTKTWWPGPASCGAGVPSGSSWSAPRWVEPRLSSPQRRSTLLASLHCQHHGSSVVLMLSLLSAALILERSFSSDGKTRASLATPVRCTER